jgi:hypothetical protein
LGELSLLIFAAFVFVYLVLDIFLFIHFGCYFDAALVLDRMVVAAHPVVGRPVVLLMRIQEDVHATIMILW